MSFTPPICTLMGPGPSDVHPRVLLAMARPTIGHLDPAFIDLMDDIKALLQYAFRTQNALTMAVSAPGSAGMETCFVNLLEAGDKVIVCENGVFGGRMRENVERCGAQAIMVKDDWGRAVDCAKVEAALKEHSDASVLAFVHAETSTGALSDARALAELARKHDCLTIVDAVTSLGGVPLLVDEWGLDAVYSGSQKCLSCTPGLSPITFGERAVERVRGRASAVQSWFLDLSLVMNYWGASGKRAYHHTAPINALYGLHESLLMLHEEGIENAWQRHADKHRALRSGLEAMGLRYAVPEGERIPHLNAIEIPQGIDEAQVRRRLLEEYSLEIGAGLGALAGKVWRVGLMGNSATDKNIFNFLSALESILADMQAPVRTGLALTAARAALAGT